MNLFCLFEGVEIVETNIESFDIEISNISDNSKNVCENDLFICMEGHLTDGHGYIGEALERRAAVVVIEKKDFSGDFPYIRVTDTRTTFSMLWNNLCQRPAEAMHLIAVTGTNGKSSTVELIHKGLCKAGKACAVIGTLNSSMTTPDPPQLYPRLKKLRDRGCEYVVMEASSHALELSKLTPLWFDVGIFMNLTRDHLDFHQNMYNYAASKAKLFSRCSIALFNRDDKFAKRVVRVPQIKRYSFSLYNDAADFLCKNVKMSLTETNYDFLCTGELFHIKTHLTGSFFLYNTLAAAACLRILGIDKKYIKEAFQELTCIRGRAELVYSPKDSYKVFIDYAHTPDALEKLLLSLRSCMEKEQRLVCIFGCGGDRDRTKRPFMGEIATRLSDLTIITSDNPRSEDPYDIIRDIIAGIEKKRKYLVIADRKSAIQYAVSTAGSNDVLVFCGKGHEDYEINRYGKIPFDERKLIEEFGKDRENKNEHYSR